MFFAAVILKGLSINIEAFFVVFIAGIFLLLKGRADRKTEFIQKNFLKGSPEKLIGKKFHWTPDAQLIESSFGTQNVNVRVPFEWTTKSVKRHYKTWGQDFFRCFVGVFIEATKKNFFDGIEE